MFSIHATLPKSQAELANEKLIHQVDYLYKIILIPQLTTLLFEIHLECLLNNSSITSHRKYQETVELLDSIPPDQVVKYNKAMRNGLIKCFATTDYVKGFEYFITHDPNALTIPINDLPPLILTMRHTKKETFKFLLNYFEKEKINPFHHAMQEAVIKASRLLDKQLRQDLKKLPIQHHGYTYSDLLENACLMGNLSIVQKLCEYKKGKYLNQFNFYKAIEAALCCQHDEITFYLIDKQIANKKLDKVILQLYSMLTTDKYRIPGDFAVKEWFFRKEFVEKLIIHLLNLCKESKLSKPETSAVLKIPVLYLMTAFPYYSKEEFDNAFGEALTLLEKNLPLPTNIILFIKDWKIATAKIEEKKQSFSQMNLPIYEINENIPALCSNLIIDKNFSMTILNLITNLLLKKNHESEYKYLLNNISYHQNFSPKKLFGEKSTESFQAKIAEDKRYVLFTYFFIDVRFVPLNMEDTCLEFFTSFLQRAIDLYIKVEHRITKESLLVSATWGHSKKTHIEYLDEMQSLIDTGYEATEKFPDNSHVIHIYSVLTVLIESGINNDCFFDKAEPSAVVKLLSDYVKLGQHLLLEDKIRYIELIPTFERFNMFSHINVFLKKTIEAETTSQKDDFFRLPLFNLLLLQSQVMQSMQVNITTLLSDNLFMGKFLINKMLQAIAFSILRKDTPYSLNKDNLNTAAKEIQSHFFSAQASNLFSNQFQNKLNYPVSFGELVILHCDIFLRWMKNISYQPESPPTQFAFLKMKELIFKVMHALVTQSMGFNYVVGEHRTKADMKIFRKKENFLYRELNEALVTVAQELFIATEAMLSLHEPKLENDNFSLDIKSNQILYKNNEYTRLNVRMFTAKKTAYNHERRLEAYDLESDKRLTDHMSYFCGCLVYLNNAMSEYFETIGDTNLASHAKNASAFFSDPDQYKKMGLFKIRNTLIALETIYYSVMDSISINENVSEQENLNVNRLG